MSTKDLLLPLLAITILVFGKSRNYLRTRENHSTKIHESKYLANKRREEETARSIIRRYTKFVFENYSDNDEKLNTIIQTVDKWARYDSGYAPDPERKIRIPKGLTKTDIMHFGKNVNIDLNRPRIDVACLMKSLFIDFENDENSSLIARMSDRDRKHTVPIFDKSMSLKDNMMQHCAR